MRERTLILAILFTGLFGAIWYEHPPHVPNTVEVSSTNEAAVASTAQDLVISTSSIATSSPTIHPKKSLASTATTASTTGAASTSTMQAARIRNPYPTTPGTLSDANTAARAALVNIVCDQRNGSLQPISGSGVIIDPRGIILTNAHVAQYVLLSEVPSVNLSCYVATGAPAKRSYFASVLYISSDWVSQHAQDVNSDHPMGTGEHDFALLYITGALNNVTLPAQFPYISPDTREAVAFTGDQMLVASYPAEFAGGLAAEYGLYPASSETTIASLLTFSSGTVDLISLGGVIEAQSGSSGGAVVNPWQRLVGIITTTSPGATTGARDLRALTLSYIDRDLKAQTGKSLSDFISGDLQSKLTDFTTSVAPDLLKQFAPYLSS